VRSWIALHLGDAMKNENRPKKENKNSMWLHFTAIPFESTPLCEEMMSSPGLNPKINFILH